MPPGFCFTPSATPSLPLPPTPPGPLKSLSAPGPDFHSGHVAASQVVNTLVVPELSERWTATTPVAGRPGLLADSWLSFQLVILPMKMPHTSAAVSFRSDTP